MIVIPTGRFGMVMLVPHLLTEILTLHIQLESTRNSGSYDVVEVLLRPPLVVEESEVEVLLRPPLAAEVEVLLHPPLAAEVLLRPPLAAAWAGKSSRRSARNTCPWPVRPHCKSRQSPGNTACLRFMLSSFSPP